MKEDLRLDTQGPWSLHLDSSKSCLIFEHQDSPGQQYHLDLSDQDLDILLGKTQQLTEEKLEIERKFLLDRIPPLHPDKGETIVQIYLAEGEWIVRLRTLNQQGILTLKKGRGQEPGCIELEMFVPMDWVQVFFDLPHLGKIEKTRWNVPLFGTPFFMEIDAFHGPLESLWIVEVELPSTFQSELPMPDWIGKEVTGDKRYYNKNLVSGIIPFEKTE